MSTGHARVFLGMFKFLVTFQWGLEQGVPSVFKKPLKLGLGKIGGGLGCEKRLKMEPMRNYPYNSLHVPYTSP